MANAALVLLYRLHRLDSKILRLELRARALSPDRLKAPELDEARADHAVSEPAYRSFKAELIELEGKQADLEGRIERDKKKMFDGSVVNDREVKALEADIADAQRSLNDVESRLLEIYEVGPEIEATFKKNDARLQALEAKMGKTVDEARALRDELVGEYKKFTGARPKFVEGIPKPLLDQYETIRKKTKDTGMALVTSDSECEACGMHVPERARELVRQDRPVECEQCRRLLFLPHEEA